MASALRDRFTHAALERRRCPSATANDRDYRFVTVVPTPDCGTGARAALRHWDSIPMQLARLLLADLLARSRHPSDPDRTALLGPARSARECHRGRQPFRPAQGEPPACRRPADLPAARPSPGRFVVRRASSSPPWSERSPRRRSMPNPHPSRSTTKPTCPREPTRSTTRAIRRRDRMVRWSCNRTGPGRCRQTRRPRQRCRATNSCRAPRRRSRSTARMPRCPRSRAFPRSRASARASTTSSSPT